MSNATCTLSSLVSTQTVESLHQQAMAEKTRQRATEETELLYLQFISDVTTDILTRGIYSNQALQLLFQSHVEKRKRELDEHILYKKLDQLKLDLGFQ
jgi:spermatogenesis-associated protein 7